MGEFANRAEINLKSTKDYGKTLTAAHGRLVNYLSEYQLFFQNKTKRFFDKAEQYTQGMLQTQRCNLEEICDTLMVPDYFQMQHFISDSNWSHRDVIDTTARGVSNNLRKAKLTGYFIDETGVEKKGDMSVGVGWQYCGSVGKLV